MTHLSVSKTVDVTVIIPIYKTELQPHEQAAMKQMGSMFVDRDVAFVCPETLDVTPLEGFMRSNWRVERFDPNFFAGRKGYNRLMLSEELYQRFERSAYLLVCQTDVWIFEDRLDEWCSLGYDYIGAPWLPASGEVSGWNLLQRGAYQVRRLWGRVMPGFHPINLKWKVGNGGFSLRKVDAMLGVIRSHRDVVNQIAEQGDHVECFEDVFWGVGVNQRWPGTLQIPDAKTAAQFAIEGHPDMAMRLTEGRLPMGAHAFQKKRNYKHWRKYITIE